MTETQTNEKEVEGDYSIVASQFPVVGGIAGHNLLVLKDPGGNVIGELNGLATSRDGKIKPIGYVRSDRLLVYHFSQPTYYGPSQSQTVVASGPKEQIMKLWNAAKMGAKAINDTNPQYPFMGLGSNSNSVASTLMACMGIEEPPTPRGAWITPGVGALLLDPDQIRRIQQSSHDKGSDGATAADAAIKLSTDAAAAKFPRRPGAGYFKRVNIPNAETDVAKKILHNLIGFNTTTSSHPDFAQDTTKATEYVGKYLHDNAGAAIQYSEPFEYPPHSGRMHKTLLAVWKPEAPTDKKPLAFSGHIDVVPAPNDWQGNDPFKAREEDKKIIGRGALDLKGQVASLMATFQGMHQSGEMKKLDRPVIFMLSSCEEVGLLGAEDVCRMVKQHNLTPGEVIVMEPTDGYIGLGAKGTRQEVLSFNRTKNLKEHEVWPHYCTVTIQSGGGHSSIQGASPADPALASVAVLGLVKQLRKDGVPTEICDIKYGVADNVVGGKARITIGYAAAKAGGDINELFAIPEFLRHQLEDIQQHNANLTLSALTVIANTVNRLKNEVTGMDFGKVSIKVDKVAPENPISYPATVTKTKQGLQSNSAIEYALAVVGNIYELHSQQRKGGRPKDYALPILGLTKLSVPLLNGDSKAASLTYDMRSPVEAQQENDEKLESTASIINKVHDAARANSAFEMHAKENINIKPYAVSPQDERLRSYVQIARETGFTKYRSVMTNLPYASDGNVINKQFPDALVVTMASGGYANLPHGEGENLTEQQILKNLKLYEKIISRQAMPNGKRAAPSLSH